jgi:hypothetical protein
MVQYEAPKKCRRLIWGIYDKSMNAPRFMIGPCNKAFIPFFLITKEFLYEDDSKDSHRFSSF